jgi:hypothetical protein
MSWGWVRTTFTACIAVSLCGASPSFAQVLLEGRVLDDSTEQPLSGARVILLNRQGKTSGYAVTDSEGRFRFEDRDWGWYRLEATAVGYERARTPYLWWTVEHDFAGLELRLAPNVVLLAPLEITALSPRTTSPILENAEFRRSRGLGVHITREQIEQRGPANITDMLLEIPGVYARRSGVRASGGRQLYMGRALAGVGGGECPVQVFLDGVLVSRGGAPSDVIIDELVSPLDVEIVEVFRGLGSIPPEFLTPEARCGVVAIWTKRSLEVGP